MAVQDGLTEGAADAGGTQGQAAEAEIRAHTTPGRARLELLAVGLGGLAVSMAQTLLVPVLQTLPGELGASSADVEWLLTSTLLVAAVSVPVLGRLGDMYGKRRMLLISLAALVIGSLITCFTDNLGLLILGRGIQGVSIAAIPLGISLLATLLPRDKVGSAIAVISAMLGVGGALALPIGGLIGQHADFHALFWLTAAIGAVAFAAIAVIVPESPVRTGGRIDLVGTALLSAALVCLLLPLAESSSWGWTSARTLGLLGLGVVLVLVFGWTQTRIAEPLVDLVALRRPPIILTNLASVLFGFGLFASMIGTAGYLQAPESTGYGFGASIVFSGVCMLPGGLAMLFLSDTTAGIIRRIGGARTLALGGGILAVGWLMRIVLIGELWMVVVGSAVVGIGAAIGYAAMPSLINEHTPPTEIAAANGLNSLARSLGTSIASAAGGSLLAAHTVAVEAGTISIDLPSLGGYRLLFALCVAASVAASALALAIPRRTAE